MAFLSIMFKKKSDENRSTFFHLFSLFLALFSEKYKADQRFRTMRRLALQMFGFWTFPQTVFRISFGFYRRSVLRFVDLVNQFLEESLTRRESSPVPTELCPF